MKLAADLHIHSCLSPCAEDEMTPNNIVNMAYIKGLDVIAVADHNSALNLPACKEIADAMGMVLLPAIEAQSREEVHALCYLRTVEYALELSAKLRGTMSLPNNKQIFGGQTVMDSDDMPLGEEELLLHQSAGFSIDEITIMVDKMGGVVVPAHINRQSNSLLYTLGFIPPGLFSSVEVSRLAPYPSIPLDDYHVIFSSDAHQLCDIFEKDNFIPAEERSAGAIIDYLKSKKEH